LLVLGCACSATPARGSATPAPPPGTAIRRLTSTPVAQVSPTPVPAGWDTATSPNWSGYSFPQGGITGVRAQWTEPAIANVPNGYVVTWIGAGGWNQSYNNIVQIGTLAYVSGGQVMHRVWYETLPPNQWIWIGNISAGDSVSASVELKAGSEQTWDLSLVDKTTGQVFSTSVTFASMRVYADFIVEDPDATSNNGPPYYPFPRFNPITISKADVRYAQDWMPVGGVRGLQITLEHSGTVLARPGPLQNDSFTVNYA
jgi:hypothetical protein